MDGRNKCGHDGAGHDCPFANAIGFRKAMEPDRALGYRCVVAEAPHGVLPGNCRASISITTRRSALLAKAH
jgi:hypothetical protein